MRDLFLLMQEKELRLRTDQSDITGAEEGTEEGGEEGGPKAEVKAEEGAGEGAVKKETVSERVIRASLFIENTGAVAT